MTDPIDLQEYRKFLKKEKQASWLKLIAIAVGGFLLTVIIGISSIWAYNRSLTNKVASAEQVSFSMCSIMRRNNCVVDGDTIWMAGRKIRIADIDAPEKSDPKCESERRQALKATHRLLELVNQGSLELKTIGRRDMDQYGRDLRIVLLDGQSVGNMLVSEGLARTWTGRREPWC